MSSDKSDELVETSCIRASFGEFIAYKLNLNNQAQHIYLMGLFSMIDSLLGRPLPEILDELPLTDDIKQALLGK